MKSAPEAQQQLGGGEGVRGGTRARRQGMLYKMGRQKGVPYADRCEAEDRVSSSCCCCVEAAAWGGLSIPASARRHERLRRMVAASTVFIS